AGGEPPPGRAIGGSPGAKDLPARPATTSAGWRMSGPPSRPQAGHRSRGVPRGALMRRSAIPPMRPTPGSRTDDHRHIGHDREAPAIEVDSLVKTYGAVRAV